MSNPNTPPNELVSGEIALRIVSKQFAKEFSLSKTFYVDLSPQSIEQCTFKFTIIKPYLEPVDKVERDTLMTDYTNSRTH